MSDPYRIHDTPDVSRTASPAETRGGAVRPMLWLVLVISAAANMVAAGAGLNVFIGSAFGLIGLTCATALIVHHYRRERP